MAKFTALKKFNLLKEGKLVEAGDTFEVSATRAKELEKNLKKFGTGFFEPLEAPAEAPAAKLEEKPADKKG